MVNPTRLIWELCRCKWLSRVGCLSGLLWLLWLIPVEAKELRIAITKGVGSVKVGSSTPAVVKDIAGRELGEIEAMEAISATPRGSGVAIERWRGHQLIIEPTDDGVVWIGDRWYRGRIRLIRMGQGVTALNIVDLEEYLYSVVGGEAIPSWPLEALKAQAVAARTYALHKVSKSANRYYDLDTTTRTQVYKGLDTEFVSTQDAVNSTIGQVMTYNGQVILSAFHSSSGGHTENVEDVWSSPLPYLRGVADYDQSAPVFQWTKTYSVSQISRLIGGIGSIRSLTPERTTPHGRIVTMKIVGSRGSKRLSGTKLRQALGLRSTLFTVSNVNGTFQIQGRGYGHGIGLSQWGTYALATEGVTYDQILTHYYQNANLSTLASLDSAPSLRSSK
ncbi:MAG: SpoIID/LytB domain-containing protein [Microcystaceae cyanobacterium]